MHHKTEEHFDKYSPILTKIRFTIIFYIQLMIFSFIVYNI